MDNIEESTRITIRRIHHFACDVCGCDVGSSTEFDDGYYEQCGEFTQNVCIDKTWYGMTGHFCPKHKQEKVDQIVAALEQCGFKRHSLI